MKVLFFGDIYGRVGRKAFLRELPKLQDEHTPDFVIANIDNITSGRGPVSDHAQKLTDAGVDIMTGGDHVFDNFDAIEQYLLDSDTNLLRPANFDEGYGSSIPGIGHKLIEKGSKKLLMIHVLGQVFIHHKVSNPFHRVEEILGEYEGVERNATIIDFHKEATAEGQAMALYFDGRVSFVGGTHTHVQTNDDRVLPQGTGTITDLGMSGPCNSVIGASLSSVTARFMTGLQRGKIEQSLDPNYVVCGASIDIDESTGLCRGVEKIRIYGDLAS